jgi:hypothetical protein
MKLNLDILPLEPEMPNLMWHHDRPKRVTAVADLVKVSSVPSDLRLCEPANPETCMCPDSRAPCGIINTGASRFAMGFFYLPWCLGMNNVQMDSCALLVFEMR